MGESAEDWQTGNRLVAFVEVGEQAGAEAAGRTDPRADFGAVDAKAGPGAETGGSREALGGVDGQLAKSSDGSGDLVGRSGRGWRRRRR